MLSKIKVLILVLWISFSISVCSQVITLNGIWRGTIHVLDINFNATVPGGIFTDLQKNNIIKNNLYGKNDVNNRWVGNQSVTYTKHFNGKLITT
ncbi:hypothetical protein PUN28_017032 [Cardiocondyla obscurior]|uniref:Beta-mannosidase-like galactose-binding domain-containing protein n=1 Tax=Cardiocondyla obscurior TaxID=286306 RepID=A0AAW2EP99_9HYME